MRPINRFFLVLALIVFPAFPAYSAPTRDFAGGNQVESGFAPASAIAGQQTAEFLYREFMRDHNARRLRRTADESAQPLPRRDFEVFLNFDDHEVAGGWAGIAAPTTDFYEEEGVIFRGPNERDGGAVINQSGNFGVNGHSQPNFFGFNAGGGSFQNGARPLYPEYAIFAQPVQVVSCIVGSSTQGMRISLTAYNADDEELAEDVVQSQNAMQELIVEAPGIAYVVLDCENRQSHWVFDDLYFASLGAVEYVPEAFDVEVPIGETVVRQLHIESVGDGDLVFEIQDEGDDPDWLSADPAEGRLEPEAELDIDIIIDGEGLEPHEYSRTLLFLSNDARNNRIEIPVDIVAISGRGQLYGTVVDAANDQPLEGVQLYLTGFDYQAISDEEGAFDFGDVPAWSFTLNGVLVDYLYYTHEDVVVEPDGETEILVEMLHATFTNQPQAVHEFLAPEMETQVEVNLRNNGNGPLTWQAERVFAQGVDTPPWEQRNGFQMGMAVEDDGLQGVVFAEGHFYVAGSGDEQAMVYILDRDGQPEGSFPQIGVGRNGWRDMAFDGENLWGSGTLNVYCMSTGGDSITSFRGAHRTTYAMAWDPVDEVLWTSDITSDIQAVTREGEEGRTLRNRGFEISGLAYWSEDPDEYPLYILHDVGGAQVLHKMRTDNNDTMFVANLNPENGGSPGGAFITNQFDVYSWVFISVSSASEENGGDRVDVWQVESQTDWVFLEPMEGFTGAGEAQDLVVSLNSFNLLPAIYEMDFRFTHDGIGAETVLPVRMEVFSPDEPRPPRAFDLIYPEPDQEFDLTGPSASDSMVTFLWEESVDPNPDDAVSYRIWFKSSFEDRSDSTFLENEELQIAVGLYSLVDSTAVADPPVCEWSWWVEAISGEDVVESNQRNGFGVIYPDAVGDDVEIPIKFGIQSAYPNPFNSSLTLQFGLEAPGSVVLEVFDLSGRKLEEFHWGDHQAGNHRFVWDAAGRSSGVYLIKLTAGQQTAMQKAILMR